MFNNIFQGRAAGAELFLGSPESEAEANERSRMPLSRVYYDFHRIAEQLSGEKFIISGRKGSGKSAFAEYVVLQSKNDPNVFAKFIKKNEFSLEQMTQLADADGHSLDTAAFLRWLVYTHIIKLFLQSEAAKADHSFELLRQFLNKNSGFVDINAYDIKSIVKKTGFSVSIEYLKRFLRSRFNKDTQIRAERAPFYRLLPHLEEIIVRVLSGRYEVVNKNSYIIFFDDLDLNYTPDNPFSRDLVVEVLRVAKHINNEVFGRNGLEAKVVILLRDDIEMQLAGNYADTAKIISSYAVKLSWYQDGYLQQLEEDDLFLKSFINRRISIAFSSAGRDLGAGSPWDSLVHFVPKGKTTFKDVVNYGLFRPRDLLLYFLPLETGVVQIPINWNGHNSLASAYSSELARELKNEMRAFYSGAQIEMIFRALSKMNARPECSFFQAVADLRSEIVGLDCDEVLYYLLDRSLLGTRDINGWLTFNCRSHDDARVGMQLSDQWIVLQYGVRDYVNRTNRVRD